VIVDQGRARAGAGDTAVADSLLRAVLTRSRHPEALLFAAALAERRGDDRRRAELLRELLAHGGDTAEADAGLAALAAQAGRWRETAARVLDVLTIGVGTYRHPFPADVLRAALTPLALSGPAALADSTLAAAERTRPGWATLYELRAAAQLRDLRCEDAATQFLVLVEFGIEVADAPERLRRCRRGGTS